MEYMRVTQGLESVFQKGRGDSFRDR